VWTADNQQERLISIGWVIGFVDGEGCFSISVVRQPNRTNRMGYRTGYQLTHEFVVTQGARSVDCLRELKVFFGVGGVYANTRHDNHREHLYTYNVGKRSDLLRVVIPFFRDNPLRTAKRLDFEKFAFCVERIAGGHHLSHHGLADLLEVVETMNRQKPRTDLIRILRGHTPSPETSGEDMVRSAWRRAGRLKEPPAQIEST
jgi:LAGLIDADG DNA endonuclease family protein